MLDTIVPQDAPKIHTQQHNMGAIALMYARHGFHVFPLYEPLFDHPKGYICACEPYRHSGKCKRDDQERIAKGKEPRYLEPHQHCDRPGKHPRGEGVDANGNKVYGLKMATTDEAQIRAWWGKWPNANIGCVPGRSGHAVLDGDLYKDTYAGADLLTADEQETPTTITGSLGNHLWYAKHPGAVYSNAPGTLPAGIDVRADNGYVVLPPSLHASGRRYQWEDGYTFREMPVQLLPQRIHDILTAATAKTTSCAAKFTTAQRYDGTPSTPAPDLAKWSLSAKILHRIANPAARGDRSQHDWSVVLAMVDAGAVDDDILAVFEHHPIGTAGKFADAGRRYLELTISKARARADEHAEDQAAGAAAPFRLPRHPAIDNYNSDNDLAALMLQHGYENGGDGWHRTGGRPDPLAGILKIKPAHVLCAFEYAGDPVAMLAGLTGCPRPLPAFLEPQKWRLLEWAQSKAARDLLREAFDIRRPDGILRTLEALIVKAADHGWAFVPGVRNVAEACNGTHSTIANHLKWMNGTLWQLWQTDKGVAVDLGLLHWIIERHLCEGGYAYLDSNPVGECEVPVQLRVGVQFQHDTLADDVFVPVAYRHAMARRRPARAGHLVVTGTGRRRSCVLTVREARHRRAPALQGFSTVLLPSLGYAGRVAAAYILENPGITRAEIAEQSGVSARTLSRTLQIMERMGLVDAAEDVEWAKQYTLAEDVDERIAELLPHMTSYKTGTRRAHLAEQSRAKWLFKQYQAEQAEEKRAALKAKMRTCDEKQVLLKAELLAAGIKPANGWRPPPQWISDDRGIYTPDRDQAAQLLADARSRQQAAEIELTAGDRWRRREYAASKDAAEAQWPEFYAWLAQNYGAEFVTMDQTDVLGKYKVWEVICEAADLHFEGAAAGL